MATGQRAFIEAAIAEVREAKALVLPLLMLDEPDAPLTPAGVRALDARRDALDPVLRRALDLLVAYELPFLEEEARLEAAGVTLAPDMAAFEVAMVEFERAFWERAFERHAADPERLPLRVPAEYDLCPQHQLGSDAVRAAIQEHGALDFDDLARYLGVDRRCADCHTGVTRLLIREVKRAKAGSA